jgi:ABC-type transport system substrate-binding protein
LLAEAGHAPGSIRVTLKTAGLYRQEAEIVQQHLEAIGIRATIDIEAQAFSVIVRTRKYDDLAWGAISTPPFVGYYMGDFVRIGSNQNDTRLKDEKVHELAVAQGRELDQTKRKATIDQLQDRLHELMPWVPTLSNLYGHFQACRLRNAKQVNPAYNPAVVTSAWLDPAGC